MMRLVISPEPPDFGHKVRQPGENALALLAGQPLPHKRRGAPLKATKKVRGIEVPKTIDDFAYWQECLEDLHRAYRGICAYYGFYLERATHPGADHYFAKKGEEAHLAYEWANYRLACAHANTCKNKHPDVLDPVDVQDGWFQLNLSDLMVRADPALPEPTRSKVTDTIDRLQLNKPRAIETRERALDEFRHNLAIECLHKYYPFVAKELERQGIRSREQLPQLPPAVTTVREPERRGSDDHHS